MQLMPSTSWSSFHRRSERMRGIRILWPTHFSCRTLPGVLISEHSIFSWTVHIRNTSMSFLPSASNPILTLLNYLKLLRMDFFFFRKYASMLSDSNLFLWTFFETWWSINLLLINSERCRHSPSSHCPLFSLILLIINSSSTTSFTSSFDTSISLAPSQNASRWQLYFIQHIAICSNN